MLSDEEFDKFINDESSSEESLRRAYINLEQEHKALWTDGSQQSYYHDRYDRDALLVKRLKIVKKALAVLWISTAQINIRYVFDNH